jgi:hypothetical protein
VKNIKFDLVSFITLIIGIIATIMIFFPALTASDSNSTFLGYEVAFGTEFVSLGSFGSGQIAFSPLGILAYLAPLFASFIALFMKKGKFISLILFTISAVLLFTLPAYTKATITILNTVTDIQVDWAMSYGLIIAGVLSILGVIVCLYSMAENKSK